MRREHLHLLGLVIAASFAIACESRVSLGQRCVSDAECGDELACRFERCRAECTRASDCSGRGAVCVGEPGLGVCTIPSVDTCAGGCAAGLVCTEDTCSTSCETSADCLTGSACEPTSGTCVVAPSIADSGVSDDAAIVDARADAARPDAGPTTPSSRRTVCVGGAHACATHDGVVHCWGRNSAGQLGDGTDDFTPTVHEGCADGGSDCSRAPVVVNTLTGPLDDVIELSCSESHTCALRRSGDVYCWGSVGDGGLGGPGRGGHIAIALPGLTGVDHIVGGRFHTCARSGSHHRCWGHNATGEGGTPILDDRLGTDTTLDEGETPLDAPAWEGAIDLALGGYYTCALFATGVECRGTNESGVTGDTTTFGPTLASAPITGTAGATTIGSGVLHACVLIDGRPWCWGGGDHGQLGPLPMECGGLSERCSGVPRQVPDPRDRRFTFLSHGYADGACAISSDGEIVCWGTNGNGSSGDATAEKIDTLGAAITHAGFTLTGMLEVARGAGTACARSDMGTVFCWGAHESGQLGCSSRIAPDLLAHPVACDVGFPP
ncbi:MAG: hypothetical protein J0L92_23830 [Deltaproteobacteria bacterium]|nr:hypothetical protein [Deltaproteobacteria bacterium]